MSSVFSKALNSSIEVGRYIGKIEGDNEGPCVIFIAGIHGNEPSGVFALDDVFKKLEHEKANINGTIIGLAGNLWALERSERYHKKDLNRLWSIENIERLNSGKFIPKNEDEQQQQQELHAIIMELLGSKKGPFYFFDLHTTSSDTIPFIPVNDSLLNRKFTQQYPVPKILGIEEYLDGPILSYINELGYVSFGFESGQHDSKESIKNHIAFINLSLAFTYSFKQTEYDFKASFDNLKTIQQNVYEIYDRHCINPGVEFKMLPGFKNFQPIFKDTELAISNGEPISTDTNTTLFMPLYQAQGSDGFFLIREIHPFFLWLSSGLRKIKFDHILPLLPGVQWEDERKAVLKVNLRIARILTKQFLHLMGYRSRTTDSKWLIVKSREAASRYKEYRTPKQT